MFKKIITVFFSLILSFGLFFGGAFNTEAATEKELLAIIANLKAQIATILAQRASALPAPYKFTRNLTIGSRGPDVKALQAFLQRKNFFPAQNKLTEYYGQITANAVTKYKVSKKITPATGFVGLVTRGQIEAEMKADYDLAQLTIQTLVTNNTPPVNTPKRNSGGGGGGGGGGGNSGGGTTDTTSPTITTFTVPATSTSLSVNVTIVATDNVDVTGYLLSESPTANISSPGWITSNPTNYTFSSQGAKTLYAFVRDAAGNISTRGSAQTTITLPTTPDVTPPTINTFTITPIAQSLSVNISISATDDRGVITGYLLTESSTATLASPGWINSNPMNHTFTTEGPKTLYAYVRDAAGNVSNGKSATVTVTQSVVPDTTAPVVSSFALPAATTNLFVGPSNLLATDKDDNGNIQPIAGYLLTNSSSKPQSSNPLWSATWPRYDFDKTEFTSGAPIEKTLYLWVKDAKGNVSEPFAGKSVVVTVTLSDDVYANDFQLLAWRSFDAYASLNGGEDVKIWPHGFGKPSAAPIELGPNATPSHKIEGFYERLGASLLTSHPAAREFNIYKIRFTPIPEQCLTNYDVPQCFDARYETSNYQFADFLDRTLKITAVGGFHDSTGNLVPNNTDNALILAIPAPPSEMSFHIQNGFQQHGQGITEVYSLEALKSFQPPNLNAPYNVATWNAYFHDRENFLVYLSLKGDGFLMILEDPALEPIPKLDNITEGQTISGTYLFKTHFKVVDPRIIENGSPKVINDTTLHRDAGGLNGNDYLGGNCGVIITDQTTGPLAGPLFGGTTAVLDINSAPPYSYAVDTTLLDSSVPHYVTPTCRFFSGRFVRLDSPPYSVPPVKFYVNNPSPPIPSLAIIVPSTDVNLNLGSSYPMEVLLGGATPDQIGNVKFYKQVNGSSIPMKDITGSDLEIGFNTRSKVYPVAIYTRLLGVGTHTVVAKATSVSGTVITSPPITINVIDSPSSVASASKPTHSFSLASALEAVKSLISGNKKPAEKPEKSLSPYPFYRTLEIGNIGEDVRQLQIYLNNHGFLISNDGPGSIGNESDTFGLKTRDALRKWQISVGLPPVGMFGELSLEKMREVLY